MLFNRQKYREINLWWLVPNTVQLEKKTPVQYNIMSFSYHRAQELCKSCKSQTVYKNK